MKRDIVGYYQDSSLDWVAELDCFHNQHVRHKPPFINRPWVESLEGRRAHLGTKLDCVRCDRLEMPDAVRPYKRTPEFTNETIPKGLLKQHSTKRGVWGRIFVLEGALEYTVEHPIETTIEIAEGQQANISPQVPHSVKADGRVRFYVEFYTTPG